MTKECKIRVLLVDNHPLVLDGLRAVLETYDDIEIAGAASNARLALDMAQTAKPDVVLMDINMPLLNGIDAIELFKRQLPGTRILMLSMHDSREYISTSIMRGASGYVLKDVSTSEIVAAIHAVASGGTYFSSGVSEALLDNAEKKAEGLSSRENDVLVLVAEGSSNREIASALGISEATVETHRKNIKKKLGIASTAGLTRYAIENRLGFSES
ncbi:MULTISPECIES: response regulator transcription factor [Brucella]|uniref:Flagellar transcriptional regulator FtcR n=2 Tax=Ochrobactrum TaxID=528 RepID=A0A2P9HGH5_9HYPH|nr:MULTISPECIES: response regulator transcription factor [Brucella]RRD24525.1 DNA-binding response regulator [Brucellaceae bacterium VT-16-1752]WHT43251.1 response regulator transcription factor [Ochrobactrum sp. SSR]MDX4074302.1 response regulator transcription factor [Brucella sp. NBRC 113783]NNU59643.1 response regulator transcription factor [[Ochrobactrum] soli]TNV18680.1 response regulator transcription factor [[Ochrobactrum] teleogrylli]